MKKGKRIIIFILSCIVMLSFGLTAYASNSGTIYNADFYTPVFNLTGFGNFRGISGSIVTMPSGVLIENNMFTPSGQDWYCINTQSWTGLYQPDGDPNYGTHNAQQRIRYYTTNYASDRYTLRSEMFMSSYNNLYQQQLMGYYEEAYITSDYISGQTALNGYRVFDGFKFKWHDSDKENGTPNAQGLGLSFKQYEYVNDVPTLVEYYIVRESFIEDSYHEYDTTTGEGGWYSILPLFDFESQEMKDIISRQVRSDFNEYYFTDVACTLVVTNIDGLYIYSTYDRFDELTKDVGSYMEGVGSVINFDEISYTDWLVNAVGAFFNFQIVPGFSLGGVFAAIIGILLLKSFVNAFAGG